MTKADRSDRGKSMKKSTDRLFSTRSECFSKIEGFALPIQLQFNAGAVNQSKHFAGYHKVGNAKFQ